MNQDIESSASDGEPGKVSNIDTVPGDTVTGDKAVHGDEVHGDKISGDKVAGDKVVIGAISTEDGDVYIGDQINQKLIQVSVLNSADGAERYRRFIDRGPNPYIPDRAFVTDEHYLFAGREKKIDAVLDQIRDEINQTIVLYGPADVGKSSLLAAGVIPRLDVNGATYIYLSDYAHPAPMIRAGLMAQAEQMKLSFTESIPAADLAQAIVKSSNQGIILILDQFERFYLPGVSDKERHALHRDLTAIINQLETRFFQIIIAIRNDSKDKMDREWRHLLPGLEISPIYLGPLDAEGAKEAIEQPLEVVKGVFYDDDNVVQELVKDLDSLTAEEEDSILPADLQIVCDRLYQEGKGLPRPIIDKKLYMRVSKDKGVEYIIDLHYDRLLFGVPAEQSELARQIAGKMTDRTLPFWVTPADIEIEGIAVDAVAEVMEAMAEANLLIWHIADNRRSYAFASNSIFNAAFRDAGTEARKRGQIRDELAYAWRGWVFYDAYAAKGLLRAVQESGGLETLPPERALFLLRSAISADLSADYWLEKLDSEASRRLLRQIEEGGTSDDPGERMTRISQVRLLLGMNEDAIPPRPEAGNFGPLSWTAAAHPNADCRETATLSLAVTYGTGAVDRLESALKESNLGWRRWVELRGMLADAGQEYLPEDKPRRFQDRLGIWWWRFRRRFTRDIEYILAVSVGGGLGAGLGLGLLRFLLAIPLEEGSGFFFYSYFGMGFMLGWALAMGLLLVNPIRLALPEHSANGDDRPPPQTPSDVDVDEIQPKDLSHQIGNRSRRPAVPAVLLGGFSFTLMHLLVNLLFSPRGLLEATLIPPMALVAGLALSFAVRDQPMAIWKIGVWRWVLRLAVVILAFAFVQTLFIVTRDFGVGLVFAWSGFFYQSRLHDNLINWGLGNILSIENWFHYVAVFDAILTGIVLALGLTWGLITGSKWYVRWQSLVRAAGVGGSHA